MPQEPQCRQDHPTDPPPPCPSPLNSTVHHTYPAPSMGKISSVHRDSLPRRFSRSFNATTASASKKPLYSYPAPSMGKISSVHRDSLPRQFKRSFNAMRASVSTRPPHRSPPPAPPPSIPLCTPHSPCSVHGEDFLSTQRFATQTVQEILQCHESLCIHKASSQTSNLVSR